MLAALAVDKERRAKYRCEGCKGITCLKKPGTRYVTLPGKKRVGPTYIVSGPEDVDRILAMTSWGLMETFSLLNICPLSCVQSEMQDLFGAVMRLVNHNILPKGTGYDDQEARFCQAFDVVMAELSKEKVKKDG